MRNIYLASSSKARRKILELFGLKFKVLPSQIKEKKRGSGLSFSGLVKRNALDKAKEVAKRVKSGIIIGADTITVQDGRIYGKPKDLRDAKKMLKSLSKKPQWLYTGIAIIDKDKNKTLLDYEKTKVYMDKLTDKEIGEYFRHVSPLDKAGSFDIQGSGAFFIRRIEGCFYNVVGLPVRKLHRMLKKSGILVSCSTGKYKTLSHATAKIAESYRRRRFSCIIFFAALLVSGCSTEYNIVTGEQETFYYSTDKEVQIGQAVSKQVEKEYKLTEDLLMQKRVQDIGKKIISVCDRKEIDYYFSVLEEDEINAFALPGGWVYVNKGLVDKVASDDELAGVLAHEIGHIVARHSIKKLQALQGYSILRVLVAAAPGTSEAGTAADLAFTEILLGYSREDELLADQLGARYTKLAGFNPRAMISFLEKLQEVNKRKPLRPKSYFKTHPYVPDRIRVVKQELGEDMSFKDYINIEQSPHK